MQRLIYTVEIDEEFEGLDFLHELLDATVQDELGCKVIRSKLESPEEIILNGEWEDDEIE